METYNNHLTSNAEDSLLNRAEPAFRLRAWGQYEDVPNEIELYWKAPISDTYDDNGELNKWDGSRMYAVYKDEAVLVQRFVFDPLLEVTLTGIVGQSSPEKRAFQVAMLAASTGSALKAERMASVKACTSLGAQM